MRDREGEGRRGSQACRAHLLFVGPGGGSRLLVRVDIAERVEGADEVHLLPRALLSGQSRA